MIKVSDYIFQYIYQKGIRHVFLVVGGGAMHLNDSLGRNQKLKYTCTHHEQAAAMAAEGYFRAKGKMAAVLVTSGPGGTNTLTGLIGQWLDSVPCLYLSGQIKLATSIASYPKLNLRQLGDQEINIVDIVKPVTKYAAMVKNANKIKWHLDKAISLTSSGRPGPVWLDIPLDIQNSLVSKDFFLNYGSPKQSESQASKDTLSKIARTVNLLKQAKRPVFLAGRGIALSNSRALFNQIVKQCEIPVICSFNGFDLMSSDNRLLVGRVGTIGDRAGNFAIQNSDLIISLGSRNNIRQVSYNWKAFGRSAKKVVVDIDQAELRKPSLKPDIAIRADAGYFLRNFQREIKKAKLPSWNNWLNWCNQRKKKYPVILPNYKKVKKSVNPYYFIHRLTECLSPGSLVVAGNGTASVVYFQTGIVKKNQRVIWNSGCASMGYGLPAAIGACFANNKKPVICLTGEGSLQMNIQELQTIAQHNLPIKLFVLNNQSYISIKQTQKTYFNSKYIGCDKSSGVSFPDIIKIAKAYNLSTDVISSHKGMKKKIISILRRKCPLVCEVKLVKNYKFSPKLSSERRPDGTIISRPLEDMYPFLSRQEFKQNMLIPLWSD